MKKILVRLASNREQSPNKNRILLEEGYRSIGVYEGCPLEGKSLHTISEQFGLRVHSIDCTDILQVGDFFEVHGSKTNIRHFLGTYFKNS